MNRTLLVLMLPGMLYFAGCASLPETIAPADIGVARYAGRDCEQLSREQPKLEASLKAASDAQRRCRKTDIAGLLFIGLPVGSLAGCRKTAEIAELKGEMRALAQAAEVIHCPISPVLTGKSAEAGGGPMQAEEKQLP